MLPCRNGSIRIVYTCGMSAAQLQRAGWVTSSGVLAPSHDAAHVQWGGNWRMPTLQELIDLTRKCAWTWTTINGVDGHVIRGIGNYASNSIFLPLAYIGYGTLLNETGSRGYYWSSEPATGNDHNSDYGLT